MQIPLSSPNISEQDRAAVLEVLNSTAISPGSKLAEFEQAAARVTGSRHAIAVNSGTSGLHLSIKGAGIMPGDEVITSCLSFVSPANSILVERGRPVFVDIDPVTYNMDPGRIAAVVTPRTRAILPIHVLGRPCRMDRILAIAQRNGLAVIEDACEGIGAKIGDRAAGAFGQTGVFAVYPSKPAMAGEAGVIVTDDDRIAALCRTWRNQGRREESTRLEPEAIGRHDGLSDINCALGIEQLSRLDVTLARRARVARWYADALRDVPQVIAPPPVESGMDISWFVYVIALRNEFTLTDRDRLIAQLKERGIECSSYFSPIQGQRLYRESRGFRRGEFPVMESVSERTIALPFFTQMSESQVAYVCENLGELVSSVQVRRFAAVASRTGNLV